jgi:hypothetical protein
VVFEELKEGIDQRQQETKSYLETCVAYYNLWGFKVAMKSASAMAKFSDFFLTTKSWSLKFIPVLNK